MKQERRLSLALCPPHLHRQRASSSLRERERERSERRERENATSPLPICKERQGKLNPTPSGTSRLTDRPTDRTRNPSPPHLSNVRLVRARDRGGFRCGARGYGRDQLAAVLVPG